MSFFLGLFVEKRSTIESNVISPVISFSMAITASAFNRFCVIVDRNLFLIKDSFEKERSPSQTVIGSVKNKRIAIATLGNVELKTEFSFKCFDRDFGFRSNAIAFIISKKETNSSSQCGSKSVAYFFITKVASAFSLI